MNQAHHKIFLSWQEISQISEAIRGLLFFMPIFHISVCVLFTVFYSIVFQSGIENFIGYQDFFQVSIKDLALPYIATFFAISIGIGSRKLHDNSETLTSITKRYKNQYEIFHKVIYLFSAIFSLACATIYIIEYANNVYIHKEFILFSISSAALGIVHYVNSRKNSIAKKISYSFIIFPVVAAMLSGATSARNDISRSYEDISKTNAQCESIIIVRSIGQFYLGVQKDNSRVLIDTDCRIKFKLTNSNSALR